RRTSLNYPNGIVTRYTYDNAGQVLSIIATRTSDGVIISSEAYTYDAAGDRRSMTDVEGTHVYSYDNLHRLTEAKHPAGSVLPIKDETFSYDAVGNRLADAQIGGYTYNSANELTSNSSFTYTYDADGNQSGKTDVSNNQSGYSFNSLNQLSGITLADGTVWTYKYAADQKRIEKSSGTAIGQATRYIYDGSNILAVLDDRNIPTQVFTTSDRLDEIFSARSANGMDFLFHQDGLLSVRVLTDAGANIIENYGYLSYGQPLITDSARTSIATSSVGNNFMLASREFDAESGLYNNRKRYFDSHSGGFISIDPLGVSVGPAQYQYAADSPIDHADPTGLHYGDPIITVQPPTATAAQHTAAQHCFDTCFS